MPRQHGWASRTPAALLRQLSATPAPVVVFDVDGVITGLVEDDIYHLPVQPGEEAYLTSAADRLGLMVQGFDIAYRRAMVYHQAALRIGRPTPPGPYLDVCHWVQAQGLPWFTLTARSTPAMTGRLLAFLDQQQLRPSETFMIGRVEKPLQLDYLQTLFAGRLHYVDDSEGHLEKIAAHSGVRVTLHLAERATPAPGAERLISLYRSVVDEALAQVAAA
ncbi:MAG: hypothetical protein ACFB22_09355 [Rhodothalassiaceae bacterium]